MATMSEPRTTTSPVISPLISPLISAEELATVLSAAAPPVVLDVRWTLAGADRDGYLQAHLPGAGFVDLDRELAAAPGLGGRHPLPEPQALQQLWRAAGIDDESQVVVYDGGNGLGAARAWWLLRWSGLASARVLDGGLAAWAADPARPVEQGEPAPRRRGAITVATGAMPVVDADEAAALAAAPGAVLVDARAAERFRGDVEPVDPVAGHIPGSVNLPIASLMTPAGTYLPVGELRSALIAAGVADASRAAASCGSGVTACQLVLAGEVAGLALALYPGSYSQWCALGRSVAVGD